MDNKYRSQLVKPFGATLCLYTQIATNILMLRTFTIHRNAADHRVNMSDVAFLGLMCYLLSRGHYLMVFVLMMLRQGAAARCEHNL